MKTKDDTQINDGLWEATRYQNLFRYAPSGTIFARLKIRGKQVRKSLKTPNLDLAKNKLAELERNERAIVEERRRGKMLFGEALEEVLKARRCDPSLKPGTRDYDEQRARALFKSWPQLKLMDIRRINREACESWAQKFGGDYAPSTFNHTLGLIKRALERAVDQGVRYDNPARGLKRISERPKKMMLPSTDKFAAFLAEIETSGSGKSKPCANLVRFLAYSGLRKSEAAHVTWADVDLKAGTIRVYGDPIQRTKNGEFRTVPIICEMNHLLVGLKTERPNVQLHESVMLVRECQQAMNRAARVVGMTRITHHDLRHLFATRCMESGVDVLTVSRWLGHKDGGALAMRVYGHLRDEHSAVMAKKVTFGVN